MKLEHLPSLKRRSFFLCVCVYVYGVGVCEGPRLMFGIFKHSPTLFPETRFLDWVQSSLILGGHPVSSRASLSLPSEHWNYRQTTTPTVTFVVPGIQTPVLKAYYLHTVLTTAPSLQPLNRLFSAQMLRNAMFSWWIFSFDESFPISSNWFWFEVYFVSY